MKIAYFDCFSGISGNMVLGALLDAGLGLDALKEALAGLKVSGYEIKARKVLKRYIAGTLVDVKTQEEEVERHLGDILDIIEGSTLPEDVKERAGVIFIRLAETEARVHGVNVEEIHFHEVGGLDAIVDIVGSVVGLKLVGIEEVYSSPLHLGRGFVKCAHGRLPVPSPATMELVKGVPTYGRDIEAELTTPTGAAIITTLAKKFGRAPLMEVKAIGYGAGHRDLPIPNLLRVSIGKAVEPTGQGYEEDVVTLIEANIDDMNPELYEHVIGRLFEKGALDVFLTPIQMKKSRPAVKLSAIVRAADLSGVLDAFFEETTTLGVRLYEARRKKLSRRSIVVETRYGRVGVKVSKLGDVVKNISPEYEDCRRIALQLGIPLKEVYEEAKRAAREMRGDAAVAP
ncbi:MAG: nickel pincer cofactor biosynthesis protein LarC [Anaerolineae bacterium]|nr:nickel pincer cofactor biosynthesis protein LarC [Anaerolineae bacterium]